MEPMGRLLKKVKQKHLSGFNQGLDTISTWKHYSDDARLLGGSWVVISEVIRFPNMGSKHSYPTYNYP